MSKKYYSNRHKRYNKKSQNTKTTFMLRLNLSLGIAILAIGVYKLNNDFSRNFADKYKNLAAENISFSQLSDTINAISNFGKNVSTFAYSNDDSITLDESIIEYINNIEDTYTANNTPAISP